MITPSAFGSSLGYPYLFGPTEAQPKIGDPLGGGFDQPVMVKNAVSPFRSALNAVTFIVRAPFSLPAQVAEKTARETERVGASAASAIKEAGHAVAGGIGKTLSMARWAVVAVVIFGGFWLLAQARMALALPSS